MALRKTRDRVSTQQANHLRGALALRNPAGFCSCNGSSIAWYQAAPKTEPISFASRRRQRRTPEPPVIVCLHHLGSGSREFQPLIRQSPPHLRLILLDWPAHGRSGDAGSPLSVSSGTSMLHAFLQSLQENLNGSLNHQSPSNHQSPDIARPILLGSGFGAAVALSYAAAHPGNLRGLVLCEPAGLLVPRRRQSLITLRRQADAATLRQAMRMHLLEPFYNGCCTNAEASLNLAIPTLRSSLEKLPCPALFALSRDSREYRSKDYLDLLDTAWSAAPQHRISVFDGGFHPVWDEPHRFSQALNGFIQAQLPLDQHRHVWLLTAVDWPTRSMNLWRCVHPDCNAEQTLAEGLNANDPEHQDPEFLDSR